MEKQTLSNYGWIVVVALVLAVMLALATPFGTYVGDGVVSIANGFVGASDNAIDQDNITNLQNKWDNKLQGIDPALNPSGVVPEGAVYTSADGPLYYAGDTMPTLQDGDVFVYGDYEYRYGWYYDAVGSTWYRDSSQNGWAVAALSAYQVEYGAILESVNGQPVTDMNYTFWECTELTTAPVIPSSVTKMHCTFQSCISLKTAPVIPSSVTNMDFTFYGCTNLTGNIEINANPTSYYFCFDGTTQPITLSGSSPILADLAAEYSNVTVAE